jgi:hypothetical protein
MTYIVFIKDYIHHLMNESKNQTFAYINDRRVYMIKRLQRTKPKPLELMIAGLDPLQSHESPVKSCLLKINAYENIKC